jgi:hypothetical protein
MRPARRAQLAHSLWLFAHSWIPSPTIDGRHMTIIIAHKDGSGVYLFSDSAITHNEPFYASLLSSFGQSQMLDTKKVEEWTPKIVELPRRAAAAWAGELLPALNFLDNIALHLDSTDQTIYEILRAKTGPSDVERRFQLMIAYCDNGETRLALLDRNGAITHPDAGTISAGSLNEVYRSLAERIVHNVCTGLEAPPVIRIAATITALQSLSINDDLTIQSVGGAFFGVYVSDGGIQWQEDISYTIFNPRAATLDSTLANCVFVSLEAKAAVVASLTPALTKRLIVLSKSLPGYSGRPTSELGLLDIAPAFCKAPHLSVLNIAHRKILYTHISMRSANRPVEAKLHGDRAQLIMSRQAHDYLCEPPAPGYLEITMCHSIRDRRIQETLKLALENP